MPGAPIGTPYQRLQGTFGFVSSAHVGWLGCPADAFGRMVCASQFVLGKIAGFMEKRFAEREEAYFGLEEGFAHLHHLSGQTCLKLASQASKPALCFCAWLRGMCLGHLGSLKSKRGLWSGLADFHDVACWSPWRNLGSRRLGRWMLCKRLALLGTCLEEMLLSSVCVVARSAILLGIALVLTLELGPWVEAEGPGTKDKLRNATVLIIAPSSAWVSGPLAHSVELAGRIPLVLGICLRSGV